MSDDYVFEFNKNISPHKLAGLFAQVDWAKSREIQDIETMLASTTFQITAWQGGELVGFLRVLNDGTYRALIEDVIVEKRHQGFGIGRKLVAMALEEMDAVQEIILGCTNDNVPFYEQFGFERVSHVFMHKIS